MWEVSETGDDPIFALWFRVELEHEPILVIVGYRMLWSLSLVDVNALSRSQLVLEVHQTLHVPPHLDLLDAPVLVVA